MNEIANEKRTAPRQRVLKPGKLVFPNGGGVDCTVRNISATGARLDVATPVGLPASFSLVIESNQFARRCHIVWATEKQVCVTFDS
jgi:hypothetical protein